MFTAKLMKTYTREKSSTTEKQNSLKENVIFKNIQPFNEEPVFGLLSYHRDPTSRSGT